VRELDEKLVTLLDKCQAVSEIPQLVNDSGFVDVDNFPEYSLKAGGSIFDEVQRFTGAEIRNMRRRQSLGVNPHMGVEKQAFYALRQSLAHIGRHFDEGHRRLIVKDKESHSTICMRVRLCVWRFPSHRNAHMVAARSQILEVRKVADRTPLFLVLYKHYLEDDVLTSGLQVVMSPEDCQTDGWKRMIYACKTYGPLGVKLYVWARRTADYELSVAVDRLPVQATIMW